MRYLYMKIYLYVSSIFNQMKKRYAIFIPNLAYVTKIIIISTEYLFGCQKALIQNSSKWNKKSLNRRKNMREMVPTS